MAFLDAFVYSVTQPDIKVKVKFGLETIGGILGCICLQGSAA